MQSLAIEIPAPGSPLHQRAVEHYQTAENELHRHTDQLFAILLAIQWLAGIAAALWLSPQTWVGASSQTHVHVWAALFLGGAISGFPI